MMAAQMAYQQAMMMAQHQPGAGQGGHTPDRPSSPASAAGQGQQYPGGGGYGFPGYGWPGMMPPQWGAASPGLAPPGQWPPAGDSRSNRGSNYGYSDDGRGRDGGDDGRDHSRDRAS